MAYLAFHEIGGMAAARTSFSPESTVETSIPVSDRLTRLEWSVVAIARNDSRSSLRTPGWYWALSRLLFSETNPRLADARLEALRRLAVLIWHDGAAVPPHEIRAALDAGFTSEQIEAIHLHIGSTRAYDDGTVALL